MATIVSIYNGRVMGYMTIAEYAKINGVKESTIRVWIKRGKIPKHFLLKIGNSWWINTSMPKMERKRSHSKQPS